MSEHHHNPEKDGFICILPQRASCPFCTALSLFWKIGILFHVLFMVAMALTLLLSTMAINRIVADHKIDRAEDLASHQRTLEAIQQARNATLENRAIQGEIRGMVNSWIQERRQLEKKSSYTQDQK